MLSQKYFTNDFVIKSLDDYIYLKLWQQEQLIKLCTVHATHKPGVCIKQQTHNSRFDWSIQLEVNRISIGELSDSLSDRLA